MIYQLAVAGLAFANPAALSLRPHGAVTSSLSARPVLRVAAAGPLMQQEFPTLEEEV